jgi:hypothetical protein
MEFSESLYNLFLTYFVNLKTETVDKELQTYGNKYLWMDGSATLEMSPLFGRMLY